MPGSQANVIDENVGLAPNEGNHCVGVEDVGHQRKTSSRSARSGASGCSPPPQRKSPLIPRDKAACREPHRG